MIQLCKELAQPTSKQIDRAVAEFIDELDLEVDKVGMYNQTIVSISKAVFLGDPETDFWLSEDGKKVNAYVLARFAKDIDNSLCYWISQAWASKEMRNHKFAKECWKKLQDRATDCGCKHIVIVSCRNDDAFNRFLGGNFKKYATLLTMTLEDKDNGIRKLEY